MLTKRDRERDKRHKKNYRWSLERRNRLSAKQEHRCGICGKPESLFKQPLQIDHEHFKVEVIQYSHALRSEFKWIAYARFKNFSKDCSATGPTKEKAIAAVREIALPRSVRGLLCPGRYAGCNRLLGRVDNIIWLKNAIQYLENPPAEGIRE